MMSTSGNDHADRNHREQPTTQNNLRATLQGCNIYLVGMMGSGKSTIGPVLADHLGYRFVDIDTLIERVSGCSIAEIFSDYGEGEFRQRESATLQSVASWHSLVVATGGGVVLKPQNWGIMRQGVVIWLNCPKQLLLRRLARDPSSRPLLNGSDLEEKVKQLLTQRECYYRQADLEISQHQDQSPGDIARAIETALKGCLRKPPHRPPSDAD